MADAKLTALTAASALAAADLFYVSQSAASRKATGTQLLALVGTTYVPLAGGTMTGALTLPAGAIGTPSLNFTGAGATTGIYSTGANNISFGVNGTRIAYINHEAFLIDGITFITQGNATMRFGGGGVADVYLQRLGNYRLGMYDVLQVSPVSLEIYGKYTDASNYERLTLTGVAGASVNIKAEGLGTGSANLNLVLTPGGSAYVQITGATASDIIIKDNILRPGKDVPIVWSDNAKGSLGTTDTGIYRGAAGQVDVTNGTAGTWRDLKLRNLLSTGYATIDSGTLTASAPALNITQTWNSGATVFTALKLNVTNTASNDNSMLCDLQLAGTSKFNVSRDGVVTTTNTILLQNILCSGSLYIPSDAAIRWSSTTSVNVANDVLLYRDAAATLAQRNGTTAQTLRIYGTADGSPGSNYQRLVLSANGTTGVTIAAEGLGTPGANQNVNIQPGGTGGFFVNSAITVYGHVNFNSGAYAVRLNSAGSLIFNGDSAFMRESAGIVEVNNGTAGTYRDLKLRNLLNTEYHQMTEMTAPSAPATNSVRIYAEDNGAGKTRLMALFATGSAVQIAIEP